VEGQCGTQAGFVDSQAFGVCRVFIFKYSAKKQQPSNFVRLEIEIVKGGRSNDLGSHLSAVDQLRMVSYIPDLG